MNNVIKKGLCLVGVYAFLILLVFLMGERITRLEQGSDFRNTNGSLSVISER